MSDVDNELYNKVRAAVDNLIAAGKKPTVQNVIEITGGRRASVLMSLNKVLDERAHLVQSIGNDIGSNQIGQLIASEVLRIVTVKTESLRALLEDKEAHIADWQATFDEFKSDCEIQIVEAKANETQARQEVENEKEKWQSIESEYKAQINKLTSELARVTEHYEDKLKYTKDESTALINRAEKRIEELSTECERLRDEVRRLTVEEARREIERAQYEAGIVKMEALQLELAEYKTQNVRLEAVLASSERDTARLSKEVEVLNARLEKASAAQGQLVDAQRTITQLQHDVNQQDKELRSLQQMLAITSSKR